MKNDGVSLSMGTGSSVVIDKCQVCSSKELKSILFLGYLPPVNTLTLIDSLPKERPSYPAEILLCSKCGLIQMGLAVDPKILFPPEYPYTSSTTKILRENFQELYRETISLIRIDKNDLVVDIGSNDGNLLSNFQNDHKVQGVTPEEIGKIAVAKGIPTIFSYFNEKVVDEILGTSGKAKIITATNVFAHMENIHEVIKQILRLLTDDGVFISESHYLLPLVENLQYDTIYHEHLRYYSLHSLQYLLELHGLEIFHVKQIPTHGGSVRVYAAKKGKFKTRPTVESLLQKEKDTVSYENLLKFKEKVVMSKLALLKMFHEIKVTKKSVVGISAPSRASTLINYVGIDDGILDSIMEIEGSHKIGKYVPGTLIPILHEKNLYKDQPNFALIFSWHIADELIPKLKKMGFRGDFIVPLPVPKIIRNDEV
ncbi:MAG TPA: class I SAM-dependent methyltransferase [Bacteriovoracaceae bacterium]|nr:class I SAM-dependent methyltransferase [Bacteriovoracaceae bacterium]